MSQERVGKLSDQSPTALVIDDDDAIRQFVIEALSRLGYPAVGGKNAQEVLDIVNETPSLRVLISDVCVGADAGPELVRQALRRRPDLKVVFMSGGFDNIAFRRTDPLLKKPFDLQRLRNAVENVFNQIPQPAAISSPISGERRRISVG